VSGKRRDKIALCMPSLPFSPPTTCTHSFCTVPTSVRIAVSGFSMLLSLPWQHNLQTEEWVFMPSAPPEGLGLIYVMATNPPD